MQRASEEMPLVSFYQNKKELLKRRLIFELNIKNTDEGK
jgi:hypothetical protein